MLSRLINAQGIVLLAISISVLEKRKVYVVKNRLLLHILNRQILIPKNPKGPFIFPELKPKLTTEPFHQIGKPFQWQRSQQPTQPKKYEFRLSISLTLITGGNIGKTPETPEQLNNEKKNDLEEDSE